MDKEDVAHIYNGILLSHKKEQAKTPEEQLIEVEIDNLPEKESIVMIVKMIQDLGKRIKAKKERIQKLFNKELEDIKNKQS